MATVVAILDVGSKQKAIWIFRLSYTIDILKFIMIHQSILELSSDQDFQDGCHGGHLGCQIWTKNNLDFLISIHNQHIKFHNDPSKLSGVISTAATANAGERCWIQCIPDTSYGDTIILIILIIIISPSSFVDRWMKNNTTTEKCVFYVESRSIYWIDKKVDIIRMRLLFHQKFSDSENITKLNWLFVGVDIGGNFRHFKV